MDDYNAAPQLANYEKYFDGEYLCKPAASELQATANSMVLN